jgi:hypothetical protein
MTNTENIGKIGKIIIPEKIQKVIDYLHYSIGSTEWSGILFYKLTKGNMDSLKDIEFTAQFIYPMNIGEPAYTEFNYDGEVVNAYDIFEEGMECSSGLVHSHHNMATFFSGTDTSELIDNAEKYNYYVSLIVNFAHVYCAKIAIPVKSKVSSENWFKNTFGKLISFKRETETKSILIGELDVIIDNEVIAEKWLEDRIKVLKDKKISSNVPDFHKGNSSFKEYQKLDAQEIIDWASKYKGKPVSGSKIIDNKPNLNQTFVAEKNVVPEPEEFLSALMGLDINCRDNVSGLLNKLSKYSESQLNLYQEQLEENIEIIHDNMFGEDSVIRVNFINALQVLHSYYFEYGETKAFDIIDEIISGYATV